MGSHRRIRQKMPGLARAKLDRISPVGSHDRGKKFDSEIFREYPGRVCINVGVGETGWSQGLPDRAEKRLWNEPRRTVLWYIASRCPTKQKDAPPEWPGTVTNLSVVPPGPLLTRDQRFKEFP